MESRRQVRRQKTDASLTNHENLFPRLVVFCLLLSSLVYTRARGNVVTVNNFFFLEVYWSLTFIFFTSDQ